MNPAYLCGILQADELWAVGDLKKSMTNEAIAIKAPINLPSWTHLAQICMLFVSEQEERPLAMATADRAGAYKRLPPLEKDELAAAATLQNPLDGLWHGCVPKTRLFRSTAGVLPYNCLSRAMASSVCRFLKIPCLEDYGDFGIVAPRVLAKAALRFPTRFNGGLLWNLRGENWRQARF